MKKHCTTKKEHALFDPTIVIENLSLALQSDLGVSVLGDYDHTQLYRDHYDETDIDKLRQVAEFRKKFTMSGSLQSRALHTAALDDFDRHNERSGFDAVSIDLPRYGLSPDEADMGSIPRILLAARSIFQDVCGDIGYEELFEECKHSSGTTIGLKFEKTNLEDKWRFPLTCTIEAKSLFMRYLEYDPQLKFVLLSFNNQKEIDDSCFKIVAGSKLTSVGKDDTKNRTIAVEPTLNMFFQLGVFAVMVKRLRVVNLDLGTLQCEHQVLAYLASISNIDGTLDLANASNCVLTPLVRFFATASTFALLDSIRCKFYSRDNKSYSRLNIYATMGNATTFPVETLIFYSIARASLTANPRSTIPNWDLRSKVSVFGDDIIAPSVVCQRIIDTLAAVGFEVNRQKSFYKNESFRESCGADYFRGRNIRPYYVREPHNQKQSSLEPWLYIIFNRLFKKYITYFGDGEVMQLDQWLVFRYLFKLFRRHDINVKVVPCDYPDDSGLCLLGRDGMFVQLPSCNLSPVIWDEHGSFVFQYCRFQYNEKLEVVKTRDDTGKVIRRTVRSKYVYDPVHCWKALKRLSRRAASDDLLEELRLKYINKRIGGYIVSKGSSFTQW